MKKGLLFVFICLLFSIFFYSSASDLPTALNLLKAKLLTLAISLKEQKTLVKALFLNDFKTPVFKKGEPQKESAASFSQASKEYGNKTTNLCVLRSLLSDLNDDIKKNQKTQNIIKVPDFWGLKHDALWQYIQQTVNQDWASFITAQGDAKTLTDEAKTFLKNIQKNINFLFKNEKNIPKSLAQEISTFIKDKQNKLLMIRSTGREDTLKIANAGGNETII
jgi:hypothetical protein